jgi:hypothetical protein
MTKEGVEGMMLSPGYSYHKAPDKEHFLKRKNTLYLFEQILANPKKDWKFNQSPLFLEFLMGTRDYECTPWECLPITSSAGKNPAICSKKAMQKPIKNFSKTPDGKNTAITPEIPLAKTVWYTQATKPAPSIIPSAVSTDSPPPYALPF